MTDTNALIRLIESRIIIFQMYFTCVSMLDNNLMIYGFGRKIKAKSFFCWLGGILIATLVFL